MITHMQVLQRFGGTRIDHVSGIEGPCHDPYGWEEWIVRRKGHEYCLRIGGLSCCLEIDRKKTDVHDVVLPWSYGHGDDYDQRVRWLVECFERRVGMRLDDVQHAYYKMHADNEEDPMGYPWQYE